MVEMQKVALITGGGRGMGEAIARELHAEGYRLALMSPSDNCKRLAAELGGVASCVLPGYIDSLDHKPGTADKMPMKRIGQVEEIAKTTAFLLSDGAGYITGKNIRVDGGVTRHL